MLSAEDPGVTLPPRHFVRSVARVQRSETRDLARLFRSSRVLRCARHPGYFMSFYPLPRHRPSTRFAT